MPSWLGGAEAGERYWERVSRDEDLEHVVVIKHACLANSAFSLILVSHEIYKYVTILNSVQVSEMETAFVAKFGELNYHNEEFARSSSTSDGRCRGPVVKQW